MKNRDIHCVGQNQGAYVYSRTWCGQSIVLYCKGPRYSRRHHAATVLMYCAGPCHSRTHDGTKIFIVLYRTKVQQDTMGPKYWLYCIERRYSRTWWGQNLPSSTLMRLSRLDQECIRSQVPGYYPTMMREIWIQEGRMGGGGGDKS